MAGRIGSDLHRARTRRELELPEVEVATRIRTRFLSAIEDEDWDVLPGGVYTRSFIRTYASYLGLDGDRLAEDYRREFEDDAEPHPGESAPEARRKGETRRSRRVWRPGWIAPTVVAAVAAIAIFAVPDDDGGGETATSRTTSAGGQSREARPAPPSAVEEKSLSIRLTAEGEVWACVLAASGRRLIDGQILPPGAKAGPFHSGSFTLSFGNGEVTMTIDGEQAEIPPTPNPIGYAVDADGALTRLSEAERPTCE